MVSSENPFKITKKFATEVKKLSTILTRRKEPLRLLFLCPEGIAFSYLASNTMTDLLHELGLSKKIQVGFDSVRLDGSSREFLEKVDYIIPRWTNETEFPKKNLEKRTYGKNKHVVFLPNKSLYLEGKGLLNPSPYKTFLLGILRREIRKTTPKPPKREIHFPRPEKRKRPR